MVEWYPTKVLVQTTNALSSPTVKIAGNTIVGATCTSKGTNLYEIGNLALTSHPTELLSITYTSGEPAVTYKAVKTIPVIISRSTLSVNNGSGLNEPFATLTNDVYKYADLVVRDGAVLTVNGTSAQNTFYDVIIYPTSKISVPENNINSAANKLNVHSLTFFGGIDEIYNGSSYDLNKYGVPQLSLKGSFGTKTVTTINYDMRVDQDQMYSFSVPYDVNLSDITYWDGTDMPLSTHLWVSAYDGQARANREATGWIHEDKFATRFGEAKLKAGQGYTISAEFQESNHTYSIIRMPMKSNVAANATEVAKSIRVYAYDNTKGATITDNHKGWNLVANPYMVAISGNTSGGAEDTKLVVGKLVETGTGPYEWKDEYRYVTITSPDGTYHYQKKFSEVTLEPFKNFYLQIATEGDLSFALASRQSMTSRILAAEDREIEFEILLNNDERSDNMGLLIGNDFTPEYEINADLEKMTGTMSVYTIYGGYKLAYMATNPAEAETLIPVGYIANKAGEYRFEVAENSDVSEIEHIWLTDYVDHKTVDLLDGAYTFTTVKGTNESRFALNTILKEVQETPTDMEVVSGGEDGPQKFIWHDKMYILNHGIIYDATGKKVREIK